jgi:hypothetical protein
MKETNFKLKQEGATFSIYDNEELLAKGMPTEEMAMHALWAVNGSNKDEFYIYDGNDIFLSIK